MLSVTVLALVAALCIKGYSTLEKVVVARWVVGNTWTADVSNLEDLVLYIVVVQVEG